jgi:hypothetical protein
MKLFLRFLLAAGGSAPGLTRHFRSWTDEHWERGHRVVTDACFKGSNTALTPIEMKSHLPQHGVVGGVAMLLDGWAQRRD